MHPRRMAGGRRLALIGALVAIVGCFLPWFSVGGETLRPLEGHDHDSRQLASLGTLALLALPFAMHPRHVALDRGLSFGILASIAVVALVLFALEVSPMPQGLLPTGAFGYWISAVGAIIMARAAFEISREPARR